MTFHWLWWKQSLPVKPGVEEKIPDLLQRGRALLGALSGNHPAREYRHIVDRTTDKIGGPLGEEVDVFYIQLACRFPRDRDFAMPPESRRLIKDWQDATLAGTIGEHVRKAQEEEWARLEARAKEAAANRPDLVHDQPDLITAPAHTVPLREMLISESELARAANAAGPTVMDGPMFPASDDEVQ